MLIQRSIILLLVMMIVLVECGEGEPEKIKSREFPSHVAVGVLLSKHSMDLYHCTY